MRDADIRAVLCEDVSARHRGDPDTKVIQELGLCQGQVRVDIAVVNGVLKGYEIKSLADTLRRLPVQVVVYSQVLDFATLVLAEAHRADAETLIPSWWEVIVAVDVDGRIELRVDRDGTRNPTVSPRALAELLWHQEALELLRAHGVDRGLSRKPRAAAWDRLVECCTLDELRTAVRERLKERQRQRPVRLQQ